MKKLLLSFSLVLVTASAFAQGEVNFNNNSAFVTTADRLVRDPSGTALVGTNWYAQLYFGAATAPESSLIPVTTGTGGTPVGPAHFRPGVPSAPGTWTAGGTRQLIGFNPGDTVTLQVRVWDGSLFPDFAAAVAGGGIWGTSTTFAYTAPALSPPPAASAFFMENLRGFQLIVPEPSVIALGVL